MHITLITMAQGEIRAGVLLGIIFLSLVSARTALAVAPTVNSFIADPPSLQNGWTTSISWDISNSGGQEIYFNCPQGVTVKKVDASSFPCKTRQAVSGNSVDASGFILINVSGATQNVPVTLYPKDSSGVVYSQGARNLTLSVQTSAHPITEFSLSTTSPVSGSPITLTWKGVDAGGVNFQFECAESVRIRSSASAVDSLPCGKPAFTQSKGISGTLSVYPINSSRSPVSVKATVFPDIGGNIYDATHSLSADFSVLGASLSVSPSAGGFRSSAARLASNDSVELSWTTLNSAGANIKFNCQEGLSVFAVGSTSKTKLSCGTPAFASPFAPSGTTTISVSNTSGYALNLEAMLLPQDSRGIYFQTASLLLNLPVFPAGTIFPSPAQIQPPPPVAVAASTTTASSSASMVAMPQGQITTAKTNQTKYIFTRPLQRGSRNADVTALQKFLARHPDLYPGGVVSGFYGPATERAVKLLQDKYNITKKGNSGYGTVGPKTRAKLNSLQ